MDASGYFSKFWASYLGNEESAEYFCSLLSGSVSCVQYFGW